MDVIPNDPTVRLENLTPDQDPTEDLKLEIDLLNHILLPRFLPTQGSYELYEMEMELLLRMSDLVGVQEHWIPNLTVNMLKNFYNVQSDCRPETIFKQINKMKFGDTFAMFLWGQSCMFTIYMPLTDNITSEPDDTTTVLVATFPGDLDHKHIYDNIGDFEITYPMQAFKIKYSRLLRSMEFANQLYILHNDKHQSTTQPISNWLVEILCDDDTVAETDFPVVTKKFRDEAIGNILYDDGFKRSRIYFCAKSLLQHSLTNQLSEDIGKMLYKIVMLQFLSKLCDIFQKSNDVSLMMYATAKLARRIEKLTNLVKEVKKENALSDELNEILIGAIDHAKSTIKKLRKRIDTHIDKLQSDDETNAELPALSDGFNFEQDINQKVESLRDYLDERMEPSSMGEMNLKNALVCCRLNLKVCQLPLDYFTACNNPIEKSLRLIDFENFVLYDCDLNGKTFDATSIRKNSFQYAFAAEPLYEYDPLATSRMVLVRLKLTAILDRIVCQQYPLLLKHRSGININIIKTLLLPQLIDVKIADELAKYFRMRNTIATGPSLIEEKNVTAASFGPAFAKQNEKMTNVRRKMLRETEESIEALRKKWTALGKKVSSLRLEMSGQCHQKIQTKKGLVCSNCRLCELENEINNVRLPEYVKTLPETRLQKNAIVFEIHIPPTIGHLRDVLHNFTEYCSGKPKKKYNMQTKIQREIDQKLTKNAAKRQRQLFCLYPSESTGHVGIGSTRSTNSKLLHVDKPFNMFIRENNCDCTFHASGFPLPEPIADDSIKSRCTLKVEKGSQYESLQWMVDGTQHTENEVLAAQWKCPDGLTLAEFKNFGCLRADGHRLQLYKLYGLIETEALSFDQPSVLSLIMQTIWECEDKVESGATREAHSSKKDANDNRALSLSMTKLLRKFVKLQKDNWMRPLKLVLVSLIAIRLIEISEDEAAGDEIVDIIDEIRIVAIDWIGKIQEAICTLSNPDQDQEQSLRTKLALVAFAGVVTFFVHPSHKLHEKILQSNRHNGYSAQGFWLQFVITLNNNNVLLGHNSNIISDVHMPMFLRLAHVIGVQLETSMRKLIRENVNDLSMLIKEQWKSVGNAKIEFSSNSQIVCAKINQHIVKVDIVTGDFLVNDSAVARLPRRISNDPLFVRVFQNFNFESQPEDSNTYCTLHKYKNCSYKFSYMTEGLVITERTEDGKEMELLPVSVLENEVPFLLIKNYSHWWNKSNNTVDFRPLLFRHKSFATEDGIEYRLSLDEGHLTHMKTGRHLFDITSCSYLHIIKQLSRLEHPNFINILLDVTSNLATIELCRMNLKFKISNHSNGSCDIISNEFSNMRVSLQQKCGTLYGLNHGLLLESVNKSGSALQLLLMPHGRIDIQRERNHVIVNVGTNSELYNPPFHLYRIDNVCCQLKAVNNSRSAWIYLAYLHAITSHGEIEPLTKICGTESALQILQSGLVWSSTPYDDETIQQLKDFTDLSPKRKIVGTIQTVKWPEFIPPHSAQDSYVFIAKKLLEDSQRLHELHFARDVTLNLETNLMLNKREYLRHLELSPNLRVADTFLPRETIYTALPKMTATQLSTETRTVSSLYHKKGFCVADEFDLWSFLTERPWTETLVGLAYFDELRIISNYRHGVNICDLWISLYGAARNERFNSEEFVLIWSTLAHMNQDIKPILALQVVERNAHAFTEAPDVRQYDISEGFYSKKKVADILRKWGTHLQRKELDNIVEKFLVKIDQAWPKRFDPYDIDGFSLTELADFYNALEEINYKSIIWTQNQKLRDFVSEVENRMRALIPTMTPVDIPQFIERKAPEAKKWQKYELNFDGKMNKTPDRKFANEIEEARLIWHVETHNSEKTSEHWWKVYESIVSSQIEEHFIDARMQPRLVLSLVIPRITSPDIDERLKMIIGALAVTIAKEQRDNRIEAMKNQKQLQPDLERELQNLPFVNWKPCDYPEWLIFEIEQNLTIRRIQIEIAKRMIHPPTIGNSKHSTMQLNMGEGKTAVIVPILAAVLANGQQVCQITVLKSLFATNVKSIRKYLGGMLNRRIYIFPCRRDMPIIAHLNEMSNIYEECKRLKGVIMSLPEYQLSLQLKLYESIQMHKMETAENLLRLQNLFAGTRCILDESDAILHPKYQLIYTVGNQLPLDGGSIRWIVMQSILRRVPHHMKLLCEKYGNGCIEYDSQSSRPNIFTRFTPCRLLNESMYSELKKAIIDDWFSDRLAITLPEMSSVTRNYVEAFLNQNCDVTFEQFSTEFATDVQNTILIFNGILQFDVLKLLLVKRWRVNYGIHSKGNRKMAVPFRAKDVAVEMTEFGHPDVAIGFTQLSYYYSGLSDVQLHTVFKILSATQNGVEIYENWIGAIPPENVDTSIQTHAGVNLSDHHQRDHVLFPLFRYNMNVIDFWLANTVFPQEAKTFPDKLMCSAWDLCSERMTNLVTGFSGTNDTMNILPAPIAQNDLDELESTNENVRRTLLHHENRHYEKLPANVSAKNIIEKLQIRDIHVLLDAGALMLEYNNKEVAQEWLKITSTERFDAAVYFDTRDIIHTIDRNGTIAEFDCSVYRDNLERCVVYLDDTHTRGTDLKFPLGKKACVTLSGEITRDKTVQACMRMRRLGHGHSIEFWASFEADLRIRKTCNLEPEHSIYSEHVIQFIYENSRNFEIENTVHWVAAAYNYTKKLAAHKLYESSAKLSDLYNGCVDREFVTLREMYSEKEEQSLTTISQSKFDNLVLSYRQQEPIQDLVRANYLSVKSKLKGEAADIKRFIYVLDEEQEKEIESEPEQQRQVERPLAVQALIPRFNGDLEGLVLDGLNEHTLECNQPHLFHLDRGLQGTKLYKAYEKDGLLWSNQIYVTRDFKDVIHFSPEANDDFLRPVRWIARIEGSATEDYILILLSSYECDRLLSAFERSTKATLYMFRPRISKTHSDLLEVKSLRITGKTSTTDIDENDAAQIKVYSGSMYFECETEQSAYCNFLGLIPRPRNNAQEIAFEQEIIMPNGYVPIDHRNSELVSNYVSRCRFTQNPVDLAIKLINAHHQFIRKESHASMILERGLKAQF